MYCKKALVGVGNILMRDDGVGVHLVNRISGHPLLPGSVRCIDGGTAALETLLACGDCRDILIVDAIAAGGEPGAIHRMTFERWRDVRRFTPHDACLLDAISMAEMCRGADIEPTIATLTTIIGVEPADISPGLSLSPVVKARFTELIDLVLRETRCERWGGGAASD